MTTKRAKQIFVEAIKLAPEDRGAFLDEQCGSDDALRVEVESLLVNHSSTVKDQSPERIVGEYQRGDTVAHFTIRDSLGSGGMGAVYLAEQSVPVKRRVALKVIKPGFDTRNTLARFQAERQALARMDHPCIAKVLEAGATDTGRPWFAMEYIKGEELLAYCDENKLDTTQRLKLFIKICGAIQHAHQRGIMHRDLKPSNILVTRGENDEPQPKVIDFGIAKAISSDLTDMTLHTTIGQLVGTLAYMSPEQVRGSDDIDTRTDVYTLGVILYELISGQVPFSGETTSDSGQEAMKKSIREADPPKPSTQLSSVDNDEARAIAKAISSDLTDMTLHTTIGQLVGTLAYMSPEQVRGSDDIDTRTDVYTLGVILYELISGQIPFSGETLSDSGQEAMKKSIREMDPPKPSTQLSSVDNDEATAIAKARGTDTTSLQNTLRRELEWIPLKALRKDRGERYASPDDLAEDVQRYLDGEALEAGPVTRRYRVKKFMKRNRVSVITAASFVLVLIAATVVALVLLAEADRHKKLTLQASYRATGVRDFVTRMIATIDTKIANEELVVLLLQHVSNSADKQFMDQPLAEAEIRGVIARAYDRVERDEEATEEFLQASNLMLQHARHHPDLEAMLNYLNKAFCSQSRLLYMQGKHEEAMLHYEKALKTQQDLETLHRDRGDQNPGMHKVTKDYDVNGVRLPRLRPQDSAHASYLREYNAALSRQEIEKATLYPEGAYEEAMSYVVEALKSQRRVLGDKHPSTIISICNIGDLLLGQGKYKEAMPYFTEALETRRRVLGDEHEYTLASINKLGNLLVRQGKIEEAMPYYVEALKTRRRVLGDEHTHTLSSIYTIGNLLAEQAKYEEAIPYLVEGLERNRRLLGDDHPNTLASINKMGKLLTDQGKYEEAMPYYVEALETQRRVHGDEHLNTPIYSANIGNLLSLQGKYEEAMPYLVEALEGNRGFLGYEHPITRRDISRLAELHDAWHQAEPDAGHDIEAAKYRRMLEEIQKNSNAEPATP